MNYFLCKFFFFFFNYELNIIISTRVDGNYWSQLGPLSRGANGGKRDHFIKIKLNLISNVLVSPNLVRPFLKNLFVPYFFKMVGVKNYDNCCQVMIKKI